MIQARPAAIVRASITSSGPLDEGQPDVVDARVEREVEVDPVLRRQRRDRQDHVRHVDALAVGERATEDDLRLQMVVALVRDAQAQLAVIEQQVGVDGGGGDDLRMGQVDAGAVARRRVEVEPEALARLQMHLATGEFANSQLWPLHIGEDADRPIEALLDFADGGDPGGVILVAAMAEVEPEDIGSGLEQARDNLRRRACRPQRRDDLTCDGGGAAAVKRSAFVSATFRASQLENDGGSLAPSEPASEDGLVVLGAGGAISHDSGG